jgi:hypothetical protein
MKAKSVPPSTPEDLATEHLVAAVESAIVVIQQRLTDLDNDQSAKWSVSDLVRLLQLRKELQGERPRATYAYWVAGPDSIPDTRATRNSKK